MTPREQLEYAAKAMGLDVRWDEHYQTHYIFPNSDEDWNPLTDQADSDRMACKLRIETLFFDLENVVAARVYVPSGGPLNVQIEEFSKHNNTDEDVCRAVREARLLVAVEIGMDGKPAFTVYLSAGAKE
jgi:hypothetical protein